MNTRFSETKTQASAISVLSGEVSSHTPSPDGVDMVQMSRKRFESLLCEAVNQGARIERNRENEANKPKLENKERFIKGMFRIWATVTFFWCSFVILASLGDPYLQGQILGALFMPPAVVFGVFVTGYHALRWVLVGFLGKSPF